MEKFTVDAMWIYNGVAATAAKKYREKYEDELMPIVYKRFIGYVMYKFI